MYHVLKRVDYGERTFSIYHNASTHTLEEAQIILQELNALASNRPNEDTDDIIDRYIISKDIPASLAYNNGEVITKD
jgi:hypothetical protein